MKLKRTKRMTAYAAIWGGLEHPRRTRWRKKTEFRHARYGMIECSFFSWRWGDCGCVTGYLNRRGDAIELDFEYEGHTQTLYVYEREVERWRYSRCVTERSKHPRVLI